MLYEFGLAFYSFICVPLPLPLLLKLWTQEQQQQQKMQAEATETGMLKTVSFCFTIIWLFFMLMNEIDDTVCIAMVIYTRNNKEKQ